MHPRRRELLIGLAVAAVAALAVGIAALTGALPGGAGSPSAITRPPTAATVTTTSPSATAPSLTSALTLTSATTSTTLPTTPVACKAATLAASVLSDTPTRVHSPGMSHHGLTVSVVNIGSTACTLSGYLGVGMYDATGRLVSARNTTRGGSQYANDPGPHPLVLAPGTAAFADIAWSNATGRTPEASVAELRVIPPGDTVQLTVPLQTVLGADGQISETALSALPAPLRG